MAWQPTKRPKHTAFLPVNHMPIKPTVLGVRLGVHHKLTAELVKRVQATVIQAHTVHYINDAEFRQ